MLLRGDFIRPGEHLADAGVGMAPEHPAPVFERFYRVGSERSRKLVGTGLGLSIVKHLLEAQGEAATATSTVGEVSKFAVSLPRGVC
ncbi:MAG: ATP-binding protein [Armatimonadota bacterium]